MSTPATPGNPALRKAAKRAVMAGTAALAAVAVTSLVKRRLNQAEPSPAKRQTPPFATPADAPAEPRPREEAA